MANNDDAQALVSAQSEIDKALIEADRKIKKTRSRAIGTLLDKATDVLSGVLDTDDPQHENMRMRAAELSISLYTAQESAERADKQLDIQARRLEIESKKVGISTVLLQQNNINVPNPPTQNPPPEKNMVRNTDGSLVDVNLLARKKAQQMLLDGCLQQAQQLAQAAQEQESEEDIEIYSQEPIDPLEILKQQENKE